MTLQKKRWLIVAVTVLVVLAGWVFLGDFADKWAIAVALIGSMVEWQTIRCPMCDRHMGWWDKEICAACAAAIAESEEKERQNRNY